MDIQTSLLTIAARENSGSETIKRYDFQKDFSLKLIIDSYLSKSDFAILFEFHDDILVLDSASNPSWLEFYQVKTKGTNGNWTLTALLKFKEWENSILWKMYLNKELFPKYTRRIFLVSNARFNLKLKNWDKWEEKTDISWSELEDAEVGKINTSLKNELSLTEGPNFEVVWNFHVTDLSLRDSQQHCVWKLSGLIEEISPGATVNPQVAYRAIYDHIKKKSSAVFSEIETVQLKSEEFENLIRLKWMTKNEFQAILEAIGVWKDPGKTWLDIEQDLKDAWLNVIEIKPYKRWWQAYRSAMIADSDNMHVFKEVLAYVRNRAEEDGFGAWLNLIQICDQLYGEVDLKYRSTIELYDAFLIKGLILNVIYEQ